MDVSMRLDGREGAALLLCGPASLRSRILTPPEVDAPPAAPDVGYAGTEYFLSVVVIFDDDDVVTTVLVDVTPTEFLLTVPKGVDGSKLSHSALPSGMKNAAAVALLLLSSSHEALTSPSLNAAVCACNAPLTTVS